MDAKKNTKKLTAEDKRIRSYRNGLKKGSLAKAWKDTDEVVAVNVGPGSRCQWAPGTGVTHGVEKIMGAGYGKYVIPCRAEKGDRVVFVLAPESRQAMGELNAWMLRCGDDIAKWVAKAAEHDAFVAGEKAGKVFASATIDHIDAWKVLGDGTVATVATLVDVKPVACEFGLDRRDFRYETMAARRVRAERVFEAEGAAIEGSHPDVGGTPFPLGGEAGDE